MLRLHPETDAQVVPRMHHSIHANSANTLHRLGEKLPDAVSFPTSAVLPGYSLG
jgi:hypothetical protein